MGRDGSSRWREAAGRSPVKSGERRGECIVAVAACFEHQMFIRLRFRITPSLVTCNSYSAAHRCQKTVLQHEQSQISLARRVGALQAAGRTRAARTTEQQTSPKEHKTNKSNCAFLSRAGGDANQPRRGRARQQRFGRTLVIDLRLLLRRRPHLL